MKLELLKDKHKGETIYIVGTGPSMRFFPTDFFYDKITIGLKRAWKYIRPTYVLSTHPEALPDDPYDYKIVTKRKPKIKGFKKVYDFQWNKFYLFKSNLEAGQKPTSFDLLEKPRRNFLYLGRGVQTTGLCLAAHMGASVAVLVGVDCCSLGGQYHGHDQYIRLHGLEADDVFREYYKNTAIVRYKLKLKYQMDTLFLTPFIGLKNAEEEYRRLMEEYDLAPFPEPEDTSGYKREKVDFK